ncbi:MULTISPECIES: SDR family NAD(P)-dependent oxidoreductase [unclassified Leptolyngbya]|uniref:SDR family NAD(P)-dependent oxidoreductase n=1 Tax=unclassified Leptolyngbya TaxID=2650499 RepID=UPI001683FED9|nr:MULTISPECIES: SDR family NAD(P)-dependent oxidoreductase [unclassified Leptolyngbya]MBD1913831.1 SDR family NAD(P)-dependent oxidoreductase [Leptolyngbya sp. FACHB-8]MBD2157341.1 SDR family NAD(P)-dependent oxidoreductase [Leptolyngbya sp. FACHB-16]
MTQLKDAVVLITGATGGFGQEITRQLLMAGSRLILADLDGAKLEQLAAMQSSISAGKVLACVAAELSTVEGCELLYKQVQALNTSIDILINNAGIAVFGRMDEVPRDQWERLMQINLLAPMRLSSLFVPEMIARRSGHIVNISSAAGWVAIAGLTHYATSKFGLRGFSEGLQAEVKPYNVRVTAVYPFFSRTPILQSKRYGSLQEKAKGIPDNLITDPAVVIRHTIRAIERNQLHVFPDRTAYILHLLKRFAPWLLKSL